MTRATTHALYIIARRLQSAQIWADIALGAVKEGRPDAAYEFSRECWRDTLAAESILAEGGSRG